MWWRNKTERRIHDLEEAFEKLTRDQKRLDLDWLDTLDKVKSLMGRIAKRAEVVERGSAERAPGDSDRSHPPNVGDAGGLAPVDPISAKILARRNRVQQQLVGGGPGGGTTDAILRR